MPSYLTTKAAVHVKLLLNNGRHQRFRMKTRLDNGEKLNIIDVRETWEHEEFNIGAQTHPFRHIATAY